MLTRKLKTKTFVLLINIHLDSLTAKFHKRLEELRQAIVIRQAYNVIA
jgi:hypothetical protein